MRKGTPKEATDLHLKTAGTISLSPPKKKVDLSKHRTKQQETKNHIIPENINEAYNILSPPLSPSPFPHIDSILEPRGAHNPSMSHEPKRSNKFDPTTSFPSRYLTPLFVSPSQSHQIVDEVKRSIVYQK